MTKRTIPSAIATAVRVLAVSYLLLLGAAGMRVFSARIGILTAADKAAILGMPCVLCVFLFLLYAVLAAHKQAAARLSERLGKGWLVYLCLLGLLFSALHSGASYFIASLPLSFSFTWYRLLSLYPIPLILWRAVRLLRRPSPSRKLRSQTEETVLLSVLMGEVTAQFAQFAERGLTEGMYVYSVQADQTGETYSRQKNEEELCRVRAYLLPKLKARGFRNVRIELKETEYEHIFVPDAQTELPTIFGMAEDSDGRKNIVQGTVTTYYEPKTERCYSADILIYARWDART